MAPIASLRPVSHAEIADSFGYLGLIVFALTAWVSPQGNWAALGLCLFAFALSPAARQALRRDPLGRYGLVFGLYLLAQTAWGVALFPDTLARQLLDFGRWLLLLFGFLAIAWWLHADLRRINLTLMAAALSLGLGLSRRVQWSDLAAFRAEHQTGFQMSAGCSGLISATVMLGLLLFAGRLLRAPGRRWQVGLRVLAWLAGMYLSAYMLVASQSRTAWGASLIVFPAIIGYRYYRAVRRQGWSLRGLPYLPLVAFALLVGGIAINGDSILRRISPDKETVAMIWQGKDDRLPFSSIKYRYHVQKFGIEKWLERPLTGWGTGSPRYLIRSSGRSELWNLDTKAWMVHLHSAYLEILVRFGLAGAALFAAGAWIWGRAVAGAGLPDRLPEDYRLFWLGSLALTALWALNVFQLMTGEWRAYWLLTMGLGYTFVLHAGKPSDTSQS
jgi:O-antigen ligase